MINVQKRLAITHHVRLAKETPWKHQGRQPRLGLDCIGVAIEAAKAAGEFTPEMAAKIPIYGPVPHGRQFQHWMEDNLVQIKREDLLIGDLVLLCWRSWPVHIGVIADKLRDGNVHGPFSVIHSMADQGKVKEQTLGKYQVAHSFYRLPGLAREEK